MKKEKIQISQEKRMKEKINNKQKEEELISNIMRVNEANNLSKALNKKTNFQIIVRPVLPDNIDQLNSSQLVEDTEVLIQAIDKEGILFYFILFLFIYFIFLILFSFNISFVPHFILF